MDLSKKRKADENGAAFPAGLPPTIDASAVPVLGAGPLALSPQDVRKILEPFSKDQLIDVLQSAVIRDAALLAAVRSVADSDTTQRKLFIRGLGWETTTDKLRSIFSAFGELDEAIVITDKTSGKSKGYGFVTFKHIDGAILALKEPNKKIDGRMAVAQLAVARESAGVDVSMRKIYVGNVPFEISSERLLSHFAAYGDIEEGPLGFDKQSGKQKGFAFFVYKTEEGARASLVDPMKTIDGHQVVCKLATDGKKGKPGGGVPQGPPGMTGDAVPPPGPMNSNFGGMQPFGGFSGGPPAHGHQNPSPLPPIGAAQGPGFGNQGPPSFIGGTGGGYGGGVGTGAGAYGAGGYGAGPQFGGGSGGGEYGGLNNPGSAMYRMPPSSGGYPDGGNYGLSSGYPTQMHQPPPGPRGPPAGMYQGMPPYY